MRRYKRFFFLGALFVTIALLAWLRDLASWRPQRAPLGLKVNPNFAPIFLPGAEHSPYLIYEAEKLQNLETGKAIHISPESDAQTLRIAPDGLSYAVITYPPEGTAIEWRELAGNALKGRFRRLLGDVLPHNPDVQFSLDGTQLFFLCDEGVEVFPLDGTRAKLTTLPPTHGVKQLSPDGCWFFGDINLDHNVKSADIYDVRSAKVGKKFAIDPAQIVFFNFSPDSKLAAFQTSDDDQNPHRYVVEISSGRTLWEPEADIFAFSPDSRSILVGVPPNKLEVRDAHSGELKRRVVLPAKLVKGTHFGPMAITSDGRYLYMLDDKATFWKVRFH